MNVIQYVGKVFDRLTGRLIYRSRPQMDYLTAHKLAEKHGKNPRYRIVVDEL